MRTVAYRVIAALVPFMLVLTLGGALEGCGDRVDPNKHGIVFSPNGQPLSGGSLGHPGCEEALGAWYDRIVAAGPLTELAFTADARRQFAAMDLDHTGLLTPADLSRFRASYVYIPAHDHDEHRRKHSDEDADDRDDRTGHYDSSDDRADPVMSADRRNRNEVDLGDFLAYAAQNFAHLDTNHDGQLSRDELLASCPK